MLYYSPPPMQRSFLRGGPIRLSSCLYGSVCRRLSWSPIARCSDEPSSPQSISPPPPPQSAPQLSKSSFPILSPMPSTRFLPEGSDNGFSNSARFRSAGSRSDPSSPSIPGKFSKYSKPISRLHTERLKRKEQRRDKKAFRKPMGDVAADPDPNALPSSPVRQSRPPPPPVDKIPEWMEQYRFSYSEVPAVPIIGFRETPWSPFGPEDMLSRPWTGSAPLKASKKKLPEFDSFNPPPLGKKGVKYVQRPGPFPPGQGPKPAKTREEILGEPLTKLEIQEVVNAVNKRAKQINLGRDGLTHNMLDVVHSHWKRSVCCKIKCKGVPTVDLDNVARVVEEKTGGVIIQRGGGVMFVFRGRNYNYKDRPKIPIMLWKPPEPVYPKLIQRVPEGLTEDEARQLRAKGRRVAPLCKLAKNGVYMTLVKDVRAQFQIDEVVRVDCEGMNATDYKKIGAKLKELVPCTLLSFEKEQIIMCRNKPALVENIQPNLEGEEKALDVSVDPSDANNSSTFEVTDEAADEIYEHEQNLAFAEIAHSEGAISVMDCEPQNATLNTERYPSDAASAIGMSTGDATAVTGRDTEDISSATDIISDKLASVTDGSTCVETLFSDAGTEEAISVIDGLTDVSPVTGFDDVDVLWQKAIDEGKALQLDNQIADPDVVYEKASELAEVLGTSDSQDESLEKERTTDDYKIPSQVPPTTPFDVPPMGALGVDELAKLLAP